MPAMAEPVTVSAASRVTGIPERTIRRWVKLGQLPAMAGPGGKLVDLDALRELGNNPATLRPSSDTGRPDSAISATPTRPWPATSASSATTAIEPLVQLLDDVRPDNERV